MSLPSAFTVDKRSDVPIWAQIRQRLAFCISSGKYAPGEQLPTVRELAIQLDVNYHTVNKAYRELEGSGLIEIRPGRGSFVVDSPNPSFIALEGDVHAVVAEYAERLLEFGMMPEEVVRAVADHLCISVSIDNLPKSAARAAEAMRRVG